MTTMTAKKMTIQDEWFIAQVERGIHSARTEPSFDHASVMRDARNILESKALKRAAKVG